MAFVLVLLDFNLDEMRCCCNARYTFFFFLSYITEAIFPIICAVCNTCQKLSRSTLYYWWFFRRILGSHLCATIIHNCNGKWWFFNSTWHSLVISMKHDSPPSSLNFSKKNILVLLYSISNALNLWIFYYLRFLFFHVDLSSMQKFDHEEASVSKFPSINWG